MLKVWIVGSSGQIGTAINEVLDPMEIEVFEHRSKTNWILHRRMRCFILAISTVRMSSLTVQLITDTALCEKKSRAGVPRKCTWGKESEHCCTAR